MQTGGLRTKGITKSSRPGEPLISVITVVYNGAATLEQTILSVIEQTYSNIEYIIIDGYSTDGTLDIIKQYEDGIDYWQSEPDKGIYDAMNKGIDFASGSFINFMNAGDSFANSTVTEKIKNYTQDILYGNIFLKKESSLTEMNFPDKFRFFYFSRNATVCHQAIFARKTTFYGNKFDLHYKIIADRIWLKKCIEDKKCSYFHFDYPVCIYDVTGISSDLDKLHKESMRFIKKEYGMTGVLYAKVVSAIYILYSKIKKYFNRLK